MATVAILCLLLLERFLASDMDIFTEPVLRGLRVLEKTALRYTQNVLPSDILPKSKKLSQYYLFTPDTGENGVQLRMNDKSGFQFFHPDRETKIIIHGFLDKVKIADWMHSMKDELLLYDHFNVIIVDWSHGNFIPYSQAAANTERVGEEIAALVLLLVKEFGSHPGKFHLIGHSLGSHVAGYVGEKIKGLQRITGLDPATHLFSTTSPRSRLDKTDADFVDVIHTDGGGIGMLEPVGHVDFYPNGGQVQPGCTASNSVRSLIEKGVIEGVRNIICSHMRAPLLFTDSINARHCAMFGYRCSSEEDFDAGKCDSCWDAGCALMGYHVDTDRHYGNWTTFYLLTAKKPPYCGYEYKITLRRIKEDRSWKSTFRRSAWPSGDMLHVFVYGQKGSDEFTIEGKDSQKFQADHVVFSRFDLGAIHGIVIRWTKKPLTGAKGLVNTFSSVITGETSHPFIDKVQIKPMKNLQEWGNVSGFTLCVDSIPKGELVQKGSTFRSENC